MKENIKNFIEFLTNHYAILSTFLVFVYVISSYLTTFHIFEPYDIDVIRFFSPTDSIRIGGLNAFLTFVFSLIIAIIVAAISHFFIHLYFKNELEKIQSELLSEEKKSKALKNKLDDFIVYLLSLKVKNEEELYEKQESIEVVKKQSKDLDDIIIKNRLLYEKTIYKVNIQTIIITILIYFFFSLQISKIPFLFNSTIEVTIELEDMTYDGYKLLAYLEDKTYFAKDNSGQLIIIDTSKIKKITIN